MTIQDSKYSNAQNLKFSLTDSATWKTNSLLFKNFRNV